ncbi:hypothetical protein ACWCQK_35870 [Streptomyces sp. NPDC002306]
MPPRPLKAAITMAMATAFSLAAVPAQAVPGDLADPFAWTDLTRTYTATGRYGYEPLAAAGGYARSDVCLSDPTLGAAGHPYVNPDIATRPPDPEAPAALIYTDGPDGRRKLAGVEWIVPAGPAVTTRPTLFGHEFQGPENVPGVGSGYTLRAWIYQSNPSGLFSPWNPTVTCPAAPAA